ncbi:MAG TPA: secretin N-terminal domain-containing protein, partial [Candidatus Krumholzibacteria bacterium]|nr:secretin N-terminal domain-containing protein [Candidatus Krumholzibacteria bacterium]
DVTRLDSIDLAQSPIATTYTINPTGQVQYQEYKLDNPSRLVIDLVGVKNAIQSTTLKADGAMVTAVRTSQFQNEPDAVTRVVFELAEGAHYKVSRRGNSIDVSFSSAPGVMGASVGGEAPAVANESLPAVTPQPAPAESTAPAAEVKSASVTQTPAEVAGVSKPSTPTEVAVVSKPSTPTEKPAPKNTDDQQAAVWPNATSDSTEPKAQPQSDVVLAQANSGHIAAEETNTPIFGSTLSNQAMTIDVQGADIKTVLRSISEFSGVNIVSGPEVEGSVVIHLKNVPWKEALDTILKSQGYDWRDDYGIIRVAPTEQLQEDEIKAVTVERKKEEMGSLVTRAVKLDYISAEEAKTALSKMTTPRGSIDAEKGTNTLIISEVPKRADEIVAMVKEMDKKLSQVEIVAKMVDVDHEATRELGVNWAALNLNFGNKAVGDVVTGQRLVSPYGTVRVGTVQSWGDLTMILDAMEKDNKANIISNPRITTADNQEARIMVGKEIPLIVSDEAGNAITELKKIGVILRCTPHVNSDGTITMDLHPELSDLSEQATVQGGVIITLQEADTRVVVRDGETAVIGGLISESDLLLRNGVPVLKDMPLLGPLFRFESKTKKKRELIIFVTPKLVG